MATDKSKKFNCDDIEKNVHAYIDDRLNDREKVLFEEHLDYCLPCDKKLEFEKKLKIFINLKGKEDSYPDKLDKELKKFINDQNN